MPRGARGWRDDPGTLGSGGVRGAADHGLAGNRDALRDAAALYRGDVLPDYAGEWIEADRERLRQRAKQVLTRLVDLLEQDRAFADAIEYAQQLLRLDSLDEQAWCALMRCHSRRGERATALHCTAVRRHTQEGAGDSAECGDSHHLPRDLDVPMPRRRRPCLRLVRRLSLSAPLGVAPLLLPGESHRAGRTRRV